MTDRAQTEAAIATGNKRLFIRSHIRQSQGDVTIFCPRRHLFYNAQPFQPAMKLTPLFIAGLICGAPLIGSAQINVGVGFNVGAPVREAPPPPRAEVMQVAPGPGYVWISGHWAWRHGWYWAPGH
jgi:hypothetical protein